MDAISAQLLRIQDNADNGGRETVYGGGGPADSQRHDTGSSSVPPTVQLALPQELLDVLAKDKDKDKDGKDKEKDSRPGARIHSASGSQG